MSIRATSAAALVGVAILVQGPVNARQTSQQNPQHQHQQDPAKPAAGMSAKCTAMMAEHEKMMADMKAADARLEALVQTMKSASGNDKVRAVQELVTELVQNQVDMHRQMAMMHEHMMSQMSHK